MAFMFDKSSNLIAIKDYGYSMDGKFPDMKGGGSVKNIRPNPRETITQIAKITSPAFAKKIYQHVKKVNESVNEDAPCWDTHKQVGMKTKGGKQVPNCVPKGESVQESKTKESKTVQMIYKYDKKEKKFYDKMAEHEKRIGTSEYKRFIAKALRGFDINPQKYKFIPDAEEILYQTVSK